MNCTVRARIDKETKDKADKVLKEMGITLSTAIRMYLIYVGKTGKL